MKICCWHAGLKKGICSTPIFVSVDNESPRFKSLGSGSFFIYFFILLLIVTFEHLKTFLLNKSMIFLIPLFSKDLLIKSYSLC